MTRTDEPAFPAFVRPGRKDWTQRRRFRHPRASYIRESAYEGERLRLGLSRRDLLRRVALLSVVGPVARVLPQDSARQPASAPGPAQKTGMHTFSPEDEAILDDLQQANFQFFWDQTNPETGIVRDRCNVTVPEKNDLGSIASTGFGLTALCIGAKHGYIAYLEARKRVLDALLFLWKKL